MSEYSHTQILDELIMAGEIQESSKKAVLRSVRERPQYDFKSYVALSEQVSQSDSIEEAESQETSNTINR
jgi:hypothetical protein